MMGSYYSDKSARFVTKLHGPAAVGLGALQTERSPLPVEQSVRDIRSSVVSSSTSSAESDLLH